MQPCWEPWGGSGGFLGGLLAPSGRQDGSKRPPSGLQMSQEATKRLPRAGFWIAKTAPRGPSGTSIWAPRSPNWTPRSPNLGPKNLPRGTFWRPEIHISIKCQKNPFFLAKRVPQTLHFGGFLEPFLRGKMGLILTPNVKHFFTNFLLFLDYFGGQKTGFFKLKNRYAAYNGFYKNSVFTREGRYF